MASLSLAYVPGIHVLLRSGNKDVDGRDKPGHDGKELDYPAPSSYDEISIKLPSGSRQ